MMRHAAQPAFIRVSVEDITRRAYEIYLERGRVDGHDREDWRRAENELRTPARYGDPRAPGDDRGTMRRG